MKLMIQYILKKAINTAKLMPDNIKLPILKAFVSVRMRLYWFSMKKMWQYHYLIDLKKNIKIAFNIEPHPFDIYVVIWYLKKYSPQVWHIIIDGWWFHGIVWLYLAKLVWPTWKVFIFEPDPVNYVELDKNIKLNNATNVIALQKWIWSESSTMDFIVQWQWSSVYIPSEWVQLKNVCKVELVNPVEELKKYGINKIDFVKMDIEWAEIDVIEWMKNYLKTNNVNFAIASYHVLPWETEKTCKKLESLFHEVWYEYKTGFFGHLTTYAAKKR